MNKKTVVITGAGSGIGRAIAQYFSELQDWNTVALVRATQKSVPNATYLGVNIASPHSVKQTFSAISGLYGSIDLLINSAGVYMRKPFKEASTQDIDHIIDTNVKGTMYCSLEAIKLMKSGGRIINIGSISGLRGIASEAIYSASKHSLQGLSLIHI